MEIIPGTGIGDIRYGISEKELIDILGRPDKVDESEYLEGTGDWHRELWYSQRNLTFTFDSEDDFRLGVVTVMGSGYALYGKQLFGLELSKVRSILVSETSEIAKYEDWSSEELPEHELLIHDGLQIMFWFDFGVLSQMQCSYFFEQDNNTVIWPSE